LVIALFGVIKFAKGSFYANAKIIVQHTKREKRCLEVSPLSNERKVRELLANKISGTHLGLWLLVPEYLRLGTWDLLKATFDEHSESSLLARMALQLVNESALCVNRIRKRDSLCNQGFCLVNGLSFLATDEAVHQLLDRGSVHTYEKMQIGLLQLRRLQHHYDKRNIFAMDPHRIISATQRIMPKKKKRPQEPSHKVLQTFFCVDIFTGQPLALTIGSSAKRTSAASLQLFQLLAEAGIDIGLFLIDKEHCTCEFAEFAFLEPSINILMPIRQTKKLIRSFPQLDFRPYWAGYAVAQTTFQFHQSPYSFRLLVQRQGEKPDQYTYQAFLTTSEKDPIELLTELMPERWTIEEFFNFEGDMGWNRASTFNLNIRYGKQSLALLAQAATHQLKKTLPAPYRQWTAKHLAEQILTNMEGDIRVHQDTIIITYYRDHLKFPIQHLYQNLPKILEREGVNPKIPWLYDFKLDFRFK